MYNGRQIKPSSWQREEISISVATISPQIIISAPNLSDQYHSIVSLLSPNNPSTSFCMKQVQTCQNENFCVNNVLSPMIDEEHILIVVLLSKTMEPISVISPEMGDQSSSIASLSPRRISIMSVLLPIIVEHRSLVSHGITSMGHSLSLANPSNS